MASTIEQLSKYRRLPAFVVMISPDQRQILAIDPLTITLSHEDEFIFLSKQKVAKKVQMVVRLYLLIYLSDNMRIHLGGIGEWPIGILDDIPVIEVPVASVEISHNLSSAHQVNQYANVRQRQPEKRILPEVAFRIVVVVFIAIKRRKMLAH
jgi:hypothetical protein